jgi:hypothetical protein
VARGPEGRPGRVIAVLGMHRSGTSALAGSLQQHGLFLGRHSERNRHNPRGNRENPDVAHLNEDILRASGGSWRAPPSDVEWQPRHFERGREILSEYAGRPVWGFKDPRTLLTIEGWLQLVPDLELVGVLRDPARVAQSLVARVRNAVTPAAAESLAVEDPIALWSAYNARLLELRRGRDFPLLCFDEEAEVLGQKLERAAALLGLEGAGDDEAFFTEELRRAEPDDADLSADVTALYEELRALSL